MNKKQKVLSVALLAAAMGAASTAILSQQDSFFAAGVGTECTHHVGNHYNAVIPTGETKGSKEYWVCCKCHNHYFEAGEGNTWTDAGTPSHDFVDSLEENDDRLIAKKSIVGTTIYDYTSPEEHGEFNINNHWPASVSTWVQEFKGEYGVQKGGDVESVLRFDIGATPFEFDYVVARVYFETAATAMKVYSHYSPITESIATNQWVDLVINRSAIMTGGSNHGVAGGRYDTEENFYSDVFGSIGHTQQNSFNFELYQAGTSNLADTRTYISSISYLKDNRPANAFRTFDNASDVDSAGLLFDTTRTGHGGASYLLTYEGEVGVARANNEQAYFSFSLWNSKFKFDSVVVRNYFESSTEDSIAVYTGDVLVRDNVPTNRWVDIEIPYEAIANAGSHYFKGHTNLVPAYPRSEDKMYNEILFGDSAWWAEDVFYFETKTDSSSSRVDANTRVYCSAISTTPYTENKPTVFYGFSSENSDGTDWAKATYAMPGPASWLPTYAGETGVIASTSAVNDFGVHMADNKTDTSPKFDSIILKLYLENAASSSVAFYCGNVLVKDSVPTNTWTNVEVPLSVFLDEGSYIYTKRPDLKTMANTDQIWDVIYGDVSWRNSQVMRFQTYNSTEEGKTAVNNMVYISSISYRPYTGA